MSLPILMNHDQTKPIGFVEVTDGGLHVRFAEDMKITTDMAFQIFGYAGLEVLESTTEHGVMLIRRGRIYEWSLSLPAFAAGLDLPTPRKDRLRN